MMAGRTIGAVEPTPSVAVAFPRSPTVLAAQAWDLQANSNGRFVLGLGSQVRGHNERRFGIPWSPPAPRLRDYVRALRAIWHCWETGEKLDYRGERVAVMERLIGKAMRRIDYRHIIEWLVRKPGAFENYRYQEDLFRVR